MPTTLSIDSEGRVLIPEDLRSVLGINSGMRIFVTREGNRIILEPINQAFVESLKGSTAGGPSMTNELLKERREEDAKGKW